MDTCWDDIYLYKIDNCNLIDLNIIYTKNQTERFLFFIIIIIIIYESADGFLLKIKLTILILFL